MVRYWQIIKMLGVIIIPLFMAAIVGATGVSNLKSLTKQEFKIICEAKIKGDCSLLLAIAQAESSLNLEAKSHKDAYGIMQITQIGLKEAKNTCSYITTMRAEDLIKEPVENSMQIAHCLLVANANIMKASDVEPTLNLLIASYNAGVTRAIKKVKFGLDLPLETQQYVVKVIKYFGEALEESAEDFIENK